MRRILMLSLVLILFSLSGFVVSAQDDTDADEIELPELDATYESEYTYIRVDYPSTWGAADGFGQVFLTSDPALLEGEEFLEEIPADTLMLTFILQARYSLSQEREITPQDYFDAYLETLYPSAPYTEEPEDFALGEDDEKFGIKAILYGGGPEVDGAVYVIAVDENWLVMMLALSAPDNYAQFEAIAEAILDTVRIEVPDPDAEPEAEATSDSSAEDE